MDEEEIEIVLASKSWAESGFDLMAYKLQDPSHPRDYSEIFDEAEIEAFNRGEWKFVSITVVASLLGVRLGYSFCELIPEGMDGEAEIAEAFDVIEEFNMNQEAIYEARLVIQSSSLEESL